MVPREILKIGFSKIRFLKRFEKLLFGTDWTCCFFLSFCGKLIPKRRHPLAKSRGLVQSSLFVRHDVAPMSWCGVKSSG